MECDKNKDCGGVTYGHKSTGGSASRGLNDGYGY